MILVIDNYDFFTYNLVQYLGETGARLKVVRNDRISLKEIEKLSPEKIVISPGPGLPEEAGQSINIIRSFAREIPMLGVCLGHQAIAAAFGGRIIKAPVLMHGKTSMIYHEARNIYKNVSNPFEAARYHSLVVEEKSLPSCLKITAKASDGTIMGLRHYEYSLEGIQFHPESILTGEGKKILLNFFKRG